MTAHRAGAGLDPRVLRTREDVLTCAMKVLIEDGWEALTQPNVARRAGYSKATVYAHWPHRVDLAAEAFAQFGGMRPYCATGNVRDDLIGALVAFRDMMTEQRLDRALAILADRAEAEPALVAVRDDFVAASERPLRETLSPLLSGDRLEAVVAMLSGLVVHTRLLQGRPAPEAMILSAVDTAMHGIARFAPSGGVSMAPAGRGRSEMRQPTEHVPSRVDP